VKVDGVGCHFLLEKAEGEVAEGGVGVGWNGEFATAGYKSCASYDYSKEFFIEFHEYSKCLFMYCMKCERNV
jgi:hypothetical protein